MCSLQHSQAAGANSQCHSFQSFTNAGTTGLCTREMAVNKIMDTPLITASGPDFEFKPLCTLSCSASCGRRGTSL